MTLPRSVADVLSDHVTFEVECIDRMYLNVWVPRLAYGGGVAGFFVGHRGNRYASTALMDPMSKAFVADIHGFIAEAIERNGATPHTVHADRGTSMTSNTTAAPTLTLVGVSA